MAKATGVGFFWDLLRNKVECASELLIGRTTEEGMYAPALISPLSRIGPIRCLFSGIPVCTYARDTWFP